MEVDSAVLLEEESDEDEEAKAKDEAMVSVCYPQNRYLSELRTVLSTSRNLVPLIFFPYSLI